MRVAFLTHEPFYPPSGGGSAEAVYLVEELVRRGHGVALFCPDFADREAVARRFGVEVHPFTAWKMGRYTSWRGLKYLAYPLVLERGVRRVLAGRPVDVVLSQHAIAAVTAGRLRRRLGVPVVMNFLDYLTGFMETWPRYLAPPTVLRRLKRYELSLPVRHAADGVLTVSDTLADYFAEAGYPRERLCPIYYGYDASLFRPREEAGAPAGPPVVVMHGSFDHHHLGPIVVEAVRRVTQARPETRFRFIGQVTPTLDAFRRRMAGEVPGARIECPGFVPYAQVAAELASATVGMVPYEESTGTHCAFVAKIVEYLGVGVPVVSTSLRSARAYFQAEPAVRFAAFDGAAFGNGLREWIAMAYEARRALGREASGRVAAALDWRVIAGKAIDFVERTVARGEERR